MNTALAIVAHALRMLVYQPATTLRVILPAVLVVLGCAAGIGLLAPETVAQFRASTDDVITPDPSGLLLVFCFTLAGLLGYALMAILWHRHVLLNGQDRAGGLQPSVSVYLGYVWRAIVVGLIQLLAGIPVLVAMGVLGAAFVLDNPNGLIATLLGLAASMVFIWVALRLSVVLPAAALGQIMPVRDSWTHTRSASLALWGVALLLSGLNILVYALALLILPQTGLLSLIAQVLIYILEGLVFISVLTTLYGHLVEGRSLGQ